MNFEDRLRETFNAESNALHARPLPSESRSPGALGTERNWLSPGLLLAGLGLVCALVIGIGALVQNDDPLENVTATAGEEPTETPEATQEEPTTAASLATVTPAPEAATATATVTPDASVAVTLPTEAAMPDSDCMVPFNIGRVIDVAADDTDGGLVVHSDAGVATPVVGVLAYNATSVRMQPGCVVTADGANWFQLEGFDGGWVNGRYLAEDQLPSGAAYQIFFPKDADDAAEWPFVAPVERPVRTADGTPTSQDAIEWLLEGPTEAEIAEGFQSLGPIMEPPDRNCPRPAEVKPPDVNGVQIVQLCVGIARAGVGDDARIQTAINTTLQLFGEAVHVAVLDSSGRCLGYGPDDNICLPAFRTEDDPFWCSSGRNIANGSFELPGHAENAPSNHIADIRTVDAPGCRVVVIEMDTVNSQGIAVAGGGFVPAGTWATSSTRTGVRINLPESVEVGNGPAPRTSWVGGAALQTLIDDQWVGVWLGADEIGEARVWVLSEPARLIVAFPEDPTTPVSAGFTELDGYYLFPIFQAEVGSPVVIEGLGAAFEASGQVLIRDPRGNTVVDERFRTGNPGVAYLDFGLSFDLSPGDYELALVACDQCDDPLTWLSFTVE